MAKIKVLKIEVYEDSDNYDYDLNITGDERYLSTAVKKIVDKISIRAREVEKAVEVLTKK